MPVIPNPEEFFEETISKGREMAEFCRIAKEHRPLTDAENIWLEVGLACGITVASQALIELGEQDGNV